MKSVILLSLILPFGPAARTAEGILGLLSLPEVFGSEPCDQFAPQEVSLFSAPGSNQVGSIRVDRYWTLPPEGGCDGLTVNVHRRGSARVSALPTEEYDYEAPAAVVLQQRGRWFKLRLSDGAAWVRASARDEYFPLRQLLAREGTHITESWDGKLSPRPGMPGKRLQNVPAGTGARVLESRIHTGQIWLSIELPAPDACGDVDEDVARQRGWIRAHAADGAPTVWFASRGC